VWTHRPFVAVVRTEGSFSLSAPILKKKWLWVWV
jgi:hypothetical protein